MLVEGSSGDFKYEIDIIDRNVVLTGIYGTEGIHAEVKVLLTIDYFMDMLANAIPGKIDDAIIGAIKGAIR
jgi:hypothetical protein